MSAVVTRDRAAAGARLGALEIAALLGQHPPTPEQAAIIESPSEPLLVVAGAGSGKTETMAARVVFLIANDLVRPEAILGLTFTRKAAGELSERVRRRLRALRRARARHADGGPSTLVAPTIATYNSYAAALVGDHALRLGLEPSSRLLGEAGRWQLAHEVVEQWSSDLGVDLAPSTVTAAVLDLDGALSEHLVEPGRLRSTAESLVDAMASTPGTPPKAADLKLLREVQSSLRLRGLLVDLVEELTARKRDADLVDFGDQVAMAARLAIDVPDVGAGERARFDVVLLDEYQDTSVAQLELLRHLFGGGNPEGIGHPVTAVGDPHQSIYGWRGASAGGLERFPEHFPRRTATGGTERAAVLALSTSWRNDHAVLAAANAIAGPLRAAALAADAHLDLPQLAARPGAGAGAVTAIYAETIEDEARVVAQFIADRRGDAGPAGSTPVTAAVLCRKRSQFPVLQAALLDAGLPVEVVGLGGLLSTPEVVDIVAALEAAHDPSRGDSLMRLLTGPRVRLGLADLHALAEWSAALAGPNRRSSDPAAGREQDIVDERSIVDALDDLPRPGWTSPHGRTLTATGRERLADLAGVLRSLRSQTFLPVIDLVAEAERLLGLDIEVAARPGVSPATARANLDAFRTVAAGFSDASDSGTLGAFLAWLEAAQREERGLEAPVGEMDPGSVQLLTVHAAKGLEWDVIAVPGMVERTFPIAPKSSGWIKDTGSLPTVLRGDRANLPDVSLTGAVDATALAARLNTFRVAHAEHHESEERRLAYVALTRARSQLLVTGSWWRDATRPTSPSSFLGELVDAGVTVGPWAPDPAAPTEDGAAGKPVRPEKPSVEAPVWPPDLALGERRQLRLDAAAEAVRAAVTAGADVGRGVEASSADGGSTAVPPSPGGGRAASSRAGEPPASPWQVADLLLEERRRGSAERSTVALPAHLSTSSLVRLAADREQFALQLRRPVPLAPSVHARRGTAFHAWVESYFGAASLLDVESLPGADDETVTEDAELAALRRVFLTTEWAGRTPIAVEVDVETPIGGVVVRSRIDAVFRDPSGPPGAVVVVDWKTGRPPTDPRVVESRDLQLAVYRLAWARWKGVPLDHVQAAFVHVSTGETIRQTAPLDMAAIERLLVGGQVPAV
ncbi:MAG: UvrD/REP helicase [Actinotalea sp.]|nr:UvrD/REP helicase [Actinotalea sp.]